MVITPVSSYSVPLIALSALYARFVSDPWSSADLEEHAQLLDTLEEGTPVMLRTTARLYQGVYTGTRSDGRYRIQIEKKPWARTFCIERARALDIQPTPGAKAKLPAEQKGRKVASNSLVRELLGAAGYAFLLGAKSEVILVGARARLEREFNELSARRDGEALSIQQLVRVKEFGGTSGRFAAQWLSAKSKTPTFSKPHLVVFSNAADYLKARTTWSARNTLLVTDSTDERLDDAVAAAAEDFRSVEGATVNAALPKPPPGLNAWIYEGVS